MYAGNQRLLLWVLLKQCIANGSQKCCLAISVCFMLTNSSSFAEFSVVLHCTQFPIANKGLHYTVLENPPN